MNDAFESTVKVISNNQVSCAYLLPDDDFSINSNLIVLPKKTRFVRALTDIASYYLQFHNPVLWQEMLPDSYEKQIILSKFEKLRNAVIAANHYQGMYKNIEEFYHYYANEDSLNTFDNKVNKLLFEWFQKLLKQKIVYSQKDYTNMVLKLIDTFGISPENTGFDEIEQTLDLIEEFETNLEPEVSNKNLEAFKQESYTSSNKDISAVSAINNYSIYCNEFDEVINAPELATKQEITYLRSQLDRKIRELKVFDKKLMKNLLYKLETKNKIAWHFDQEEGLLDYKKLSQVIFSGNQRVFKKRSDNKMVSAAITLLIDNSGSMRGKPITIAAICAEIIAFICNLFNIKCEIIGFTTKEWKGGKSGKKWKQEGSKKDVGRISDIRHIIYKSFANSYKLSKLSIPVMLKESILKENIDGEALEFAYKRLLKQPAEKKYLLVISDGAPLEELTGLANVPLYLEQHLKYIISRVQRQKSIKMLAFGIAHDVTKYYPNSRKLDDSEDLINNVLLKLIEILDEST